MQMVRNEEGTTMELEKSIGIVPSSQ
jgi:hypothetical protein